MLKAIWICVAFSTLLLSSNALELFTSAMLKFENTADAIELLLSIDTEQESEQNDAQLVMIIRGPIDRSYFAIGFGNNQMLETYSIVCYANDNVEEYILSSKSQTNTQQQRLESSITIEHTENENNMKSIIITRSIVGLTNDHFSFDNIQQNLAGLDIIYAMSASANIDSGSNENELNYHGIYRNITTLIFQSQDLDSDSTTTSGFDFIDDILDDADNFDEWFGLNGTEIVTIAGDIGSETGDDELMFLFLNRDQWILVGIIGGSSVMMILIIILFYRYYRGYKLSLRTLYKAQSTDNDEYDFDDNEYCGASIGRHGGGRGSVVDHCYHHTKDSILTQLDKDILDEIHGSVIPEYDHHDIDSIDENEYNQYNQRVRGNYRGNVDDFLPNMINHEFPKELMILKDESEFEDDEEEDSLSFQDDVNEENEEQQEEEEDISDLSNSGSVRM